MLSFTRFINEAGDTARPYTYQGEKDEYGHRYHQYTFANGGRDYRVNIAHHDIPHHIAIVNFSDHTDHGDSFGVQTITNRAKHSAVRVMSTVHNIVKHHLSKHPEIEEVHFSSSPDEPSRGRLYAKYTEKHGGITDPTAYDTDHVIPARSIRSVNEAGQYKSHFTHTLYKNAGSMGDIHDYKFRHGDRKFGVDITHRPAGAVAKVMFGDENEDIGITGEYGHGAIKILSSVHNIVKHHAKTNPSVRTYSFTAPKTEPSRINLYKRYAEHHGGSYRANAKYTIFHIPADSYRSVNESEDEPARIQLGKPKGERAQKFMVDFTNDSDEHPFNPAARILHGAVVHASRDGHQVHIHDIQTTDPKSGAGTKALKHLTSLADKHSVKLNLFAKAYSNRPEHIRSTPRLIKWYEKHGFKHDEQDYDPDYGSEMTYYPK